jgi:hypothetical protein
MRLIVHWLINAAALFVLPYILSSIQVKDFVTALVVALVLGLVNAVIRPILILLTLPVTILTVGFFILHQRPTFWPSPPSSRASRSPGSGRPSGARSPRAVAGHRRPALPRTQRT